MDVLVLINLPLAATVAERKETLGDTLLGTASTIPGWIHNGGPTETPWHCQG